MSDLPTTPSSSRRNFLHAVGSGGLLAAAMAGCAKEENAGGSTEKPLRALCSNAGLESSWCTLGKQTMELWGKMLNIDITWVDGEFDSEKQKNALDAKLTDGWDFACIQANQEDSLAETCKKLKEMGTPVISMDTMIVSMDKMRETGVWCQVQPDQKWMGEQSTRYLMEKIGGKGKVIHIGGYSAHSGAQGRKAGFDSVLKDYPDVEIAGGEIRWCDWKTEKARDAFETLLVSEGDEIAGAFFHSDDMALACIEYLKQTKNDSIVVTAVDGQKEGLAAVDEGVLAATTVNPVCRIHNTALLIGQFIVRNQEKVEDVPVEVITPGPRVSQETPRVLESMLYLAQPEHCMV